jgi:hypothetical protein
MTDDTTAPVTAEGLRERIAEKLWNDEQLVPWSRVFQNPDWRHDLEVHFERVDELLAEVSPVLERLREKAERRARQRDEAREARDHQLNRAEEFKAILERLRAELAEARAHVTALQRERDSLAEMVGQMPNVHVISAGDRKCLPGCPRCCCERTEAVEAGRAALKAAIEQVRSDLIAAQRSTGAADEEWLNGIQAHVKRAVVMLGVALDAPEPPGDAPAAIADRLSAHRDVMVASVQEAADLLDAWGAELTALQAGAVVDALLDAVRKAESARSPGDAEEATDE